ncbi:MAG TPA: aldehyde dehydrogenase family protein [Elusimicrobiota bacterium]|nr:aldehyde dehydrogenase family protein [Elusimicrobiota bacterium]
MPPAKAEKKTTGKISSAGHWIGGREVPAATGQTMPVTNPATGQTMAQVARGGQEDADRAVRAAEQALQGPWSKFTPRQRARALFEVARLIRADLDALARLESQNAGKPIGEAKGEVEAAAGCFEYYAGAVSKFFGETIPVSASGLDFTLKEPVGVCALIVPWNYPVVIASWKIAPALACANAVVLKPAEATPLTALRLAQLCAKAGIPDGVVNVVTGFGPEAGEPLVKHPQVRKVSFTGSTAVGKHLMALAAPSLKRVSLELGGKSPSLIFADADLDRCAQDAAGAVFSNAGQDCCARSRALVQEKVYERFVEKVAACAKKLRVGDPQNPKTEMGPLISKKQKERVLGYVAAGTEDGADLVCGGDAPDLGGGFFVTPAVFAAVEPRMRVFKEEIFGPVLCATPFKTEDEAVALANGTEYGLSGSIWTRDVGRAIRLARRVQSGVLSVNSSSSVHIEAPFGGCKSSGVGRELGMKALELYSEVKNVFISDR